jgi:hypothetical protein
LFDGRTVRKVFLEKPDGIRKAGRSKLRWLDSTENDVKSKGVKRWMKKAEDRSAWNILQEALVKLQGPYVEEEKEEEEEEKKKKKRKKKRNKKTMKKKKSRKKRKREKKRKKKRKKKTMKKKRKKKKKKK